MAYDELNVAKRAFGIEAAFFVEAHDETTAMTTKLPRNQLLRLLDALMHPKKTDLQKIPTTWFC